MEKTLYIFYSWKNAFLLSATGGRDKSVKGTSGG